MRKITAALLIALTLTLLPTPSEAAPTVAAPTYPYSTPEVQSWWNAGHNPNINAAKATQLRNYMNGVVLNRIAAYLQAVAANYARATQHSDLVARWQGVANCESGGNWHINTGNGYYGGVQFLLSTWRSVGGQGYPHQNSAAEQAYRAEILKNRAGLGQWPHCGRYYG